MDRKFYALGTRFGMLTVVENLPSRNGKAMARCQCDCGKIWKGRIDAIKGREAASCGCRKSLPPRNDKHGMSHSKLYGVWSQMRNRCNNPNDSSYTRYGGRGISVCPEWDEAATFISWALKSGYTEGLQIDRIDNDKGYSSDNCRFVTRKENCRNRRTNRHVTIGSQTKTITEWAEIAGISSGALRHRIKRGARENILSSIGEWQ